ncbi:MAG: phosphatidate cytidylyltransferase [Butyrivibrio sp.]|nr:phosphatidate cytidylyltransferase [Butyrivibrio sp.]
MRTRIISGAVLTVILVGAVAGGRITMFLLSLLITCLGMFELYRVVGIHKTVLGVTGYVLAAAYYVLLWFDKMEYMQYYCVACGIILMFMYVCTFNTRKAKDAAFALLGIFYVAIPLSFLYKIRIIEDYGIYVFILLFVCSWIADTLAYFVGVNIGKHKFLPNLSPKKSIEGAIGGVGGAALVGLAYGFILHGTLGINAQVPFMLISAVGAFISIFGDLAASAIKRNHNIKDYSNLIPGHGGILDRFDSMIFVAPIVYIGAQLLMKYL